jgi:hypothetical protein
MSLLSHTEVKKVGVSVLCCGVTIDDGLGLVDGRWEISRRKKKYVHMKRGYKNEIEAETAPPGLIPSLPSMNLLDPNIRRKKTSILKGNATDP